MLKRLKRGAKLRAKDYALFCRQLVRLLERGVTLRPALLLLSEAEQNGLSKRLVGIVTLLDRGTSLGEALSYHRFPPLLTSFVIAGEQHDGLVHALRKCERYYRHKHDVRQKLLKALTYPLLVATLMAIALIVLQTTVLPRFAALYEGMGMSLPWYTQLILTFNVASLKFAALGLCVGAALLFFIVKKRWGVWSRLARFSLRFPFVREALQLRTTAVFSWQLGLLLQAGIPLLQAFETILASWPWEGGRRAMLRIQDRLESGFGLEASFAPEAGKSFHTFLPQQLAVGETSGLVAETLLYSGEIADEELQERLQWLTQLWEPLLIVCVGGALAVIVLTLFMPMLSIVQGI